VRVARRRDRRADEVELAHPDTVAEMAEAVAGLDHALEQDDEIDGADIGPDGTGGLGADEELLEHLRRHESPGIWETAERILVAVTAVPGTDALLRRAARMASRLKGELDVVHVGSGDGSRPGERRALAKLRELAGDVGARWSDLVDDDPARAIARFARQHQVTQIVIGSSRRSRWQQLTSGGSNVQRVIREAGAVGIDVHVIAQREPAHPGEDRAGEDRAGEDRAAEEHAAEERGGAPEPGTAES